MIAFTQNDVHLTCQELEFIADSPFNATTDFSDVNCYFKERSLDDLLEWSLATFGDKVAQVTSFGPTGMVILDRLAQVCPGLRVITVDTDFLFAETYALMEEIERRYHIHLEVHKSPLTPNIQAQVYHPNLWEVNPDQCCHIRKVLPLAGALEGLDAWISGLRRDQSNTRADLDLVAWNPKYNLVKINPLTYWTRGQMWSYILENKVPYNPLHDQGYASIGCTHCTHPTTNLGDERSGRWRGRQKTECGIHL